MVVDAVYQPLSLPKLLKKSLSLNTWGYLAAVENYLYLDIDDDFIHQLFPLLHDKHLQKPNYFGNQRAGAHISVIYPEERKIINSVDIGQKHFFNIKDICAAQLGAKKYVILLVESPSLQNVRKKYGLTEKLLFRNYWIDFHITVGVALTQ